jgi:hypothetical protein
MKYRVTCHGCPFRSCRITKSPTDTRTMFNSLTTRKAFGNTYKWALLSVLPMDSNKSQHGLGPSEVNRSLGMPKEARTTVSLTLKEMASQGLVRRYDYKIGNRRIVSYKRILPLRKREVLSRWVRS